jgi:uncharacterized repeat protein (TIGR02543 family)
MTGLLPEEDGRQVKPTMTGYIFTGWNVKLGGTGVSVKAGDKYSDLAVSDASGTSITLEAQWTLEGTYAVKYDANQGTVKIEGNIVTSIPDKTLKEWEDADLLPVLDNIEIKRTGYHPVTMDGTTATAIKWEVVENGKGVVKNEEDLLAEHGDSPEVPFIILQAQWEPNEYQVIYDVDGATTGEIEDRNGVFWWTEDLLPEAQPKKLGNVFKGWILVDETDTSAAQAKSAAAGKLFKSLALEDEPADESSQAALVSSKDDYANLAKEDTVPKIYLKALWAPKSYGVHYDLNGGVSAGEIAPKVVLWDDRNLTPDTQVDRNGYKFLSWNVSENGTGEGVLKDSIFSKLADHDDVAFITLKAAWEALPELPADKTPAGEDQTPAGDDKTPAGGDKTPANKGERASDSGHGSLGGGLITAPVSRHVEAALEEAVIRDTLPARGGHGATSMPGGIQSFPDDIKQDNWALVNLLLALLGLLIALAEISSNIRRRRREEEYAEANKEGTTKEETNGSRRRHRAFPLITALVSSVLGAIVFLFTEDLSKPMDFVDGWTILMAVIFAITVTASLFAARKDKEEAETER